MGENTRRFDDHLLSCRADQLKRMVTLWGGKGSLRKDACIELIRAGLADPSKVRAAVDRLEPYERAALALVKQAGGMVEYRAIGLVLRALGVPIPARFTKTYSGESEEVARALISRGLLMSTYEPDPGYLSASFAGSAWVFSDERLLAAVGAPEAVPFAMRPTSPPPTSTYRSPPAVALDIIGFLQAIDDLGGLGLTQKGTLRVSDARKVQRVLQWPDATLVVDGVRFEDGFNGLLSAVSRSGWLVENHGVLVLAEPLAEIAALSYPQLVMAMLRGFLSTASWREPMADAFADYYGSNPQQGRLALTVGLRSLPAEIEGFFAFADLDQMLFDRIGEHFSLHYRPQKPYGYNKTPQEVRQLEDEWRRKLRAAWLERERVWFEQILTGWLYFLGLVEIGLTRQTLVSFRLTDLGRAVFHPELVADQATAPAADAGGAPAVAWVVQPNFDIVVYLNRTTAPQLAFLERHGERATVQQFVAHYRLTRESIYRALESGSRIDDLLAELRAGAQADLPQNVAAELREWASLRERIALHRRGRLLEFPDTAARDAALDAGLTGEPIGDSFLLLDAGPQAKAPDDRLLHRPLKRVDYAAPLPKCLTSTEDGVLTVEDDDTDLLIESQLDKWADRIDEGQWRLTAERVAAAVRAGAHLSELTALLAARLRHTTPPWLGVALRNWGDSPTAVEVAGVTVLRCRVPEAIAAIKTSWLLQPYILGQLAPDTLLVDTQKLAAFQAHLAWAGLTVEPQLRLKR